MGKEICGYHGRPYCKKCNGCEECGLHACIHTKRGRKVRAKFEQMKKDGIEYFIEIKR